MFQVHAWTCIYRWKNAIVHASEGMDERRREAEKKSLKESFRRWSGVICYTPLMSYSFFFIKNRVFNINAIDLKIISYANCRVLNCGVHMHNKGPLLFHF